jgi:ectoine hydroxylase-related dioxygenase (phytanoyl-CoA dioxygenase family)
MSPVHATELDNRGYTIIPGVLNTMVVARLNDALKYSFDKHRKIQIENNNDIITEGVALHVLLDHPVFLKFLEILMIDLKFGSFLKDNYFKSPFILNSMSGLNNLPNQPNFSSIVHRDLRFYTGPIPMMINVLIMLDDFTEENGPTLLLPYSHLEEEKPTDEYFHNHAIKALGSAGSILLFNANVWHASSLNYSRNGRRALPITFTKSLIKQLLDYPRALGYDKMYTYSEELQQLLGYHARVPANLDEWYQPFDKRFYKKNQD